MHFKYFKYYLNSVIDTLHTQEMSLHIMKQFWMGDNSCIFFAQNSDDLICIFCFTFSCMLRRLEGILHSSFSLENCKIISLFWHVLRKFDSSPEWTGQGSNKIFIGEKLHIKSSITIFKKVDFEKPERLRFFSPPVWSCLQEIKVNW